MGDSVPRPVLPHQSAADRVVVVGLAQRQDAGEPPRSAVLRRARGAGASLRARRRGRVRCGSRQHVVHRRHRGVRLPAGRRAPGDDRHGGHGHAVLGHGQRAAVRPVGPTRRAAPVLVLPRARLVDDVRRPAGSPVHGRRRQPRRSDAPELRPPGAAARGVGGPWPRVHDPGESAVKRQTCGRPAPASALVLRGGRSGAGGVLDPAAHRAVHRRRSREHDPARGQCHQPDRDDRLRFRHPSARHRRLAAAMVVPAVDARRPRHRLACPVACERHPLVGDLGRRARGVRMGRTPAP